MSNDPVHLTKEGMAALRAELADLVENEHPDILRRIAEARAHGDLSENAEYHAARERKAIIVARIGELNSVLNFAEVYEPTMEDAEGRCVFGCVVKVAQLDADGEPKSEREFMLVHSLESDSAKARMSVTSPLGKALLGKRAGDIVELTVPAGEVEYEIMAVSYPGG